MKGITVRFMTQYFFAVPQKINGACLFTQRNEWHECRARGGGMVQGILVGPISGLLLYSTIRGVLHERGNEKSVQLKSYGRGTRSTIRTTYRYVWHQQ